MSTGIYFWVASWAPDGAKIRDDAHELLGKSAFEYAVAPYKVTKQIRVLTGPKSDDIPSPLIAHVDPQSNVATEVSSKVFRTHEEALSWSKSPEGRAWLFACAGAGIVYLADDARA
jgi:hypothetical protein